MPNVGDICSSKDLGHLYRGSYIWRLCKICNEGAWVKLLYGKPISDLCRGCWQIIFAKERRSNLGERATNWKGGRILVRGGYITTFLYPDDFFFSMANNHRHVMEHRLVMAKHLGRNLQRWELVHHKGVKYPKGSIENRQDNRIENLQLITDDRHKQITILENQITFLEKRIALLEVENIRLQTELTEVNKQELLRRQR